MNKITIGIPTYKRPEMLMKLVGSIADCEIAPALISSVNIIIVDNDIEKSAKQVVSVLIDRFSNYKISYFCYPFKGLSNVRNELIQKGLEHDPDFFVFVDDDEYVSVQWLNQLVKTIVNNKGDLTMGPVNSVVSSSVPPYVSCWLDRAVYPDNTKLAFIRSGNLIIRVRSLLKLNVMFDTRFNQTGGEDSYFGLQMIKKGASVFWAANAIAYETVPDNRANIKWIMKRYYNGANKFAYVLKIEKEKAKIVRKFVVSILYILIGTVAAVFTFFPIRKRYWGVLKISEGFGGVAGILTIRYAAYK
jgi:glycosyltransferase involved in cell wall biosynthesis